MNDRKKTTGDSPARGADFYSALADILTNDIAGSEAEAHRATHLSRAPHVDHVAAFNALASTKRWPIQFEYAKAFERPELNKLHSLWNTRSEGNVAARSQLTPRALKPFLPNVTIIEREKGPKNAQYRFRLLGTEIVRVFGEGTGQLLEDAVPATFAERWTAGYNAVLNASRPLRAVTKFALRTVDYLDGETFFGPLRSESGDINLILAATYTSPRRREGAVA
jgi:hypothetical protein